MWLRTMSSPLPPPPVGIGVVTDSLGVYSAMHSYLHNNLIDGVKVDCQVQARAQGLGAGAQCRLSGQGTGARG